jgi:hypothetical protein
MMQQKVNKHVPEMPKQVMAMAGCFATQPQ